LLPVLGWVRGADSSHMQKSLYLMESNSKKEFCFIERQEGKQKQKISLPFVTGYLLVLSSRQGKKGTFCVQLFH